MPARSVIYHDHQVVLSQFWGEIDDDTLKEYYEELLFKERAPAAFDEIVDFRKVTTSRVTVSGLRHVATAVEAAYKGSDLKPRSAILAIENLVYGFARMFANGFVPFLADVSVFRSPDKAVAWLGKRPDLVDRIDSVDPFPDSD